MSPITLTHHQWFTQTGVTACSDTALWLANRYPPAATNLSDTWRVPQIAQPRQRSSFTTGDLVQRDDVASVVQVKDDLTQQKRHASSSDSGAARFVATA